MSDYKSYFIGLGAGLVLGATVALNAITCYEIGSSRQIPRQEYVQQGYIAPSKLEIECKDLDGNGELESIMKIGDKPYLLREVDGKPVLSAYEIKPAEVVPKTE
ncbi:MAG: hypothetical protein AABW53_02755 [Nanoarchaeota archaeon]